MAISPTFASNFASLQKALRLSGVAAGSDAFTMIEDAVREVRVGFIRELTIARVGELVAIAYDPEAGAPANNNQALREVANLTEILWVRLKLLDTLPTHFADSGGDAHKNWNEEALTRETSEEGLAEKRKRWGQALEDNLDLLRGADTLGSEKSAQAHVPTPVSPPVPLDSAFPSGISTD